MEELIGILVAIVWIVLPILSSKKKLQKNAKTAPAPQPQAGSAPMTMEKLARAINEMDNMKTAFEAERRKQVAAKAQSNASNRYNLPEEGVSSINSVQSGLDEEAHCGKSGLNESFDLRKAIIYQTILHNKYVVDCEV